MKAGTQLTAEPSQALDQRAGNDTDLKPLSFAQQRLWFLDQLEPNSPLYNIPVLMRVTGALDTEALKRAIEAIVARHEGLRIQISSVEDSPCQFVREANHFEFKVVLVSDHEDLQGEANRLVQEETRRPFDLSKDPLLRVLVLRLKPEEHLLLITMHHIISDEWS